MTTKTAPSEALLLEIATKHFHSIETLETQNSDRLDFHDVAVWAIRAALEDAYEAGRVAGAKAMLAAAVGRSYHISFGGAAVYHLSLIHISEPTRPY